MQQTANNTRHKIKFNIKKPKSTQSDTLTLKINKYQYFKYLKHHRCLVYTKNELNNVTRTIYNSLMYDKC